MEADRVAKKLQYPHRSSLLSTKLKIYVLLFTCLDNVVSVHRITLIIMNTLRRDTVAVLAKLTC